MTADILVFVEDPGAANMVAALPAGLARRGLSARFFADGPAIAHLRTHGIAAEPVDGADAAALIARTRPRLILVGTAENPDTLGLRLIAAAGGIPTVGAVDAAANAGFRFRGRGADPLGFAPDLVLVPDAAAREAFLDLGLPAGRLLVCGHPHWDGVRAAAAGLAREDRAGLRRRLFPGLREGRSVLVFAAERSDGFDAAQFRRSGDYTLFGDGLSQGRTEIVVDEVLRAAEPLRHRLHLVLRLHPKSEAGDLGPWRAGFDQVSQGGRSLDLLHACDAVIGMTTMLLAEAALLGRPTLSVLPRPAERAWLPTLAAGLAPFVTSRETLAGALRTLVEDPWPPSATALEALFPPGAADRVCDALAAMLEGRPR